MVAALSYDNKKMMFFWAMTLHNVAFCLVCYKASLISPSSEFSIAPDEFGVINYAKAKTSANKFV